MSLLPLPSILLPFLSLTLLHLLLLLSSPTPVCSQQSLSVGTTYITGTQSTFQNLSFPIPSTYSAGYDVVIIARPALLAASSNPPYADVDLYVSGSGLQWSSAALGPDAVIINAQVPVSGVNTTDALVLGGPLSVSAAGVVVLNVGVYFRNASSAVNASVTVSYAARIQYSWQLPYNTYTGSLPLDGVQLFEYNIPFPQGCTNGVANCTEGHITFLMTPSPVDSQRRGALLGTYPSISGNPNLVPYHASTYDRSSDVSSPAFAGEMITSNDQFCYGTVGPCTWRMMVWAKYAPMPAYTFRAAVIDITTVVDSKSGDHTPLTLNSGAYGPRSISAAEMQYYVVYATVPQQALQITVQSLRAAPGASGTNVDMWVQSILSSSLPHPDDNGYSWQSALDTVQGTDSVLLTTPAAYNTPYNVTYWIACFGQRAGNYTISVQTLASASPINSATNASAILPVVDGVNVYAAVQPGFWQYYSYAVPSTYADGQHDIAIIARPALLSQSNPSNSEVDLYVSTGVSTSGLQWSSANNGPDCVLINPQLQSAGLLSNSLTDALYETGPLPVSAAGSTSLLIGAYVRNGTQGQAVNVSLMVSYAARIQYSWQLPYNTYTGSLPLDGVQLFEYNIPFPQGCTNGVANCTEGHITFLMTPSPVDSQRRGALLGTYPSISGNPNLVPYHASTYDRSSDVSSPAFAGEMITSNDQFCYGTVGPCTWRMMVWAKYAPMPAYTFRAAVIDITTVVDSKSGDHTPLTLNSGAYGPRSISAAEMQYYVVYATVPQQALQITVQSLRAAPGASGTNVDMWVQSILSSSLPHPDDNGYSWQSALDTVQGTDSVLLTTPAAYNTPYNVTYWIACFGQRAGNYTISVQTLASASPINSATNASAILPVVDGVNVYAAVQPGFWQYYSYAVPSTYADGQHDIAIIARPALLSQSNPSNSEVDLYVSTGVSTSGLQWSSANNGPDCVLINPQLQSAGLLSNSLTDALYETGPLPVSAAGSTSLLIGAYVRNGTQGQAVNVSLMVSYAARIQYSWQLPYNTYTGSLPLDGVQLFEYNIPFPQGCTNGVANCTEGHITFLMTPSPVDSQRRGALLGTYPSISGNPNLVPYHASTYDRSSDVSSPAFAGEMITSNDQFCYGTVGPCTWRMMVWAKYAPMPAYTFRAAVIDITTVVDSKSGDHTPLTLNSGAYGPRSISAAEMQYYVVYATVPQQALQITVQSLRAAPGASGTNVDMWVQSILSSSLPHPDDNGYSWQSALDTVQGTDSVLLTTPAAYNTPYNVTYWIACFGQRAGNYTISVQTLASASPINSATNASAILPVVDGVNVYAAVQPGFWQYYSYAVPSTYADGQHDIAIIARPALLSQSNPSNSEVDLYVSTGVSTSGLQWSSANNGPDCVLINPQLQSAGLLSNSLTDALYETGPLPVSAAGSTSLLIGAYVRNGTQGQAVNVSLMVSYAARIQYSWQLPYNTYTGSLPLDGVQLFEYNIPFPQGCTNGVANCTEGHITFLMTPSPVDSQRRGALLGTYPSISGNPNLVPYHASTYDRSSDVSSPAFAGEMITSNDQFCYGTVGPCTWRMMVWAKYAPMPAYTFRAAVIDITTVVDNRSGDHELLTMGTGPTAPRSITAAEMQYWVFYVTQPSLNFSLLCQSFNPGPSGTNVDVFVQSILYSSLPHPDDNGYTWASGVDLLSGVDFVNITAPAAYNSPYNVTYWVGAFGQRAGTYSLTLSAASAAGAPPSIASSTAPFSPTASSPTAASLTTPSPTVTSAPASVPASTGAAPVGSSSSSGLSGGAIAGIVIGSVVGASVLLAVCMLLVWRASRSQEGTYGKTEASRVGPQSTAPELSQVELQSQVKTDMEA